MTPSIQQLEDLVTACGGAGVPLVLDHARYEQVAEALHEIRDRFYVDQNPTNDPELQVCPGTNVAQDWTLMPQTVPVRSWEEVNPEAATRLLEETKSACCGDAGCSDACECDDHDCEFNTKPQAVFPRDDPAQSGMPTSPTNPEPGETW